MSSLATSTVLICVLLNLAAFAMFWWDKRKAAARQYRISENQLFMWSFLGGLGALTAISQLHHKNKKGSFLAIALPLIVVSILGQAILLYTLFV
jgi:uncharacterized membrane protein YsdA (DUF1294 family)